MKDNVPPHQQIALLFDGGYIQPLTKGKRPTETDNGSAGFNLDYTQFAAWCYTIAEAKDQGNTYYFGSRPSVEPKLKNTKVGGKILLNDWRFYDALRHQNIQTYLGDVEWIDCWRCGIPHDSHAQLDIILQATIADMALTYPDGLHIILVSGKDVLVPIVKAVRKSGTNVTLIHSQHTSKRLKGVCSSRHYISLKQMALMSHSKV